MPARGLPQDIRVALEGAALTPAPEVLLRLMRAIEDEGVSLGDIADIVDKDPAIAARILGAANSPVFRRSRSFASIEDSLQVLGIRVVRSIAICLSVQCVFARKSRGDHVDLSGFWWHSLMAADIARAIAQEVAYPRPGEAYLGGLLHDIGELALLSAMRESYGGLLIAADGELSLSQIEYARLDVTHCDVGAWLVDQWELDSTLADSVLFHHASLEDIAGADRLAQIVWFAHACAEQGEYNAKALAAAPELLRNDINIELICEQAYKRVALIAEAMGVTPPADALTPLSPLPIGKFEPIADLKAPAAADALMESVAETALLQSLQQELLAQGRTEEIVVSLREAIRILFGVDSTAFLVFDASTGMLTGDTIEGQPRVFGEAVISVAESPALAAQALRDKSILGHFESPNKRVPSLIDSQFARALEAPGVLCVPMALGSRLVGVAVLGVSESATQRIIARRSWLTSFARVAAAGLDALRRAPARAALAAQGSDNAMQGQISRFTHEVGNPLSIIKSYLKLLDNKLPEDESVREELAVLKEEIDRVVRIVRQLNEPPKPVEQQRDKVALNQLVQNMATLYGEALFGSKGIQFVTRLDESNPHVLCGEDGLKQIVLNLLKNASEVLGNRGSVEIETTAAVMQDGASYSGIYIRDTGPGMPQQVMQRLFSAPPPEVIAGQRGMGLSIVGGLARRMNAKIVCQARAGQGTQIGVLLPAEDGLLSSLHQPGGRR